jgi:hypothetical protein
LHSHRQACRDGEHRRGFVLEQLKSIARNGIAVGKKIAQALAGQPEPDDRCQPEHIFSGYPRKQPSLPSGRRLHCQDFPAPPRS